MCRCCAVSDLPTALRTTVIRAEQHAFSTYVVGPRLPWQEPDAHERMIGLVKETFVESASAVRVWALLSLRQAGADHATAWQTQPVIGGFQGSAIFVVVRWPMHVDKGCRFNCLGNSALTEHDIFSFSSAFRDHATLPRAPQGQECGIESIGSCSRVLSRTAAQARIALLDLHVNLDAFLLQYQQEAQTGCWRFSAVSTLVLRKCEEQPAIDQDTHDPDSEQFVPSCHHGLRLSIFRLQGPGCGRLLA